MSLIESLHQTESYLLGPPECCALFRAEPADFQVEEILGFELDGQGEHLFVQLRKTGENTDWVAQQLARHTQTHVRDIGYAGKKDRHAVTDQWFSLRLPLNQSIDWSGFESDSIQVLQQQRHGRKLKTGVHQGNRFAIRLRQVSDPEALQSRFQQLIQLGVPNYFGEQRFGHGYGNLYKAEQMLLGSLRERNRQKRGLYISALRSMLFNRVVSARIDAGRWNRLALGEVLMLNASQSCFCVSEEAELPALQERLDQGELHLTAPLWGRGGLMTGADAEAFELSVLEPWQALCVGLESLGLNQERRAVRVKMQSPAIEQVDTADWVIRFALPAGVFATSVLRELCQLQAGR
ncbi:tRNA pseudouridine 13 synthase [Nitrincola lacisaponensis]|uniref:tRNA pseudouridine synthase D n=1 Tax=Nitrincola lacisaponensis TaxID=267850 RepID=A0A063Y4B7_9GAMM|nr:tRNA pseudouridine(13) synthase TruD [Nitrincola lacisaponensis]KDE40499.1 tRNA pseudouridine 13 synthase [Nitrincola lacisaponensis]